MLCQDQYSDDYSQTGKIPGVMQDKSGNNHNELIRLSY